MKLYSLLTRCPGSSGAQASDYLTGIFFIILAFFAAPLTYSAPGDNVQTVSSSFTGYHFRIALDPEKLDWFMDSDSMWTGYTTVQVGIPYGSTPVMVFSGGSGLTALGSDDLRGKVLSRREYPLVQMSDVSEVRGRQLVSLRIFPVTGGSIYSDVEVRLEFTGAKQVIGEKPLDPLFDKIFKTVVVNYEQFSSWPVPFRPASKLTGTMAGPFALSDVWYKIAISQTGLYKVTGAQLETAGVSITGVASDDIRMYNGGGLPLDIRTIVERPEFTEMAIVVRDGGDGIFDRNDYVLFFGESQDRWVYAADAAPQYSHHPYADRNVYWLTVSSSGAGKRMAATDAVTPGPVISTFEDYIHVEQNNILRRLDNGRVTDYYNWYWTDENEFSFFVPVSGQVPDDTASVAIRARTGGSYVDLSVNGVPAFNKLCGFVSCTFRTVSLIDGANRIDLQLDDATDAPPFFDYFEMNYTSENLPAGNKLDLPLGTLDGAISVEVVNDFSVNPLVLDVSDPLSPMMVNPVVFSSELIEFNAEADPSQFTRFYLAPEVSAQAALSIEAAAPSDLYAVGSQVDLFVITPEVFVSSLDTYLDYRRGSGYSIRVVTVEDIMDNFGFGVYDPTAIRDFLKFAYENYPAPAPSAVLFVGDANYDYRDHLSTNVPNYVPSYIQELDQSASDDNYVYFGLYGLLDSDTSYVTLADRGFDMISSRWPVRSPEEIRIITEKIMRYESTSHYGIWRNKITLVADDEYSGTSTGETIHTKDTEKLDKEHIPALFTREKIYLWEYPFVGNNKPEVNDAIVDAFNEGSLIVNYVGHGNPDVWAHEHVLVRGDDLPRMTNRDKLPMVFVASCAIGFFDEPTREGMAEDFLVLANGGAIGTIAATRLVFASANAEFNQATYDILLTTDSLSMCEAAYAAKLARQYEGGTPLPLTNDRKFLFFGGPFVKLGVPRLDIEFTGAPDSLLALGKTVVSGRVLDETLGTYRQDGVLYVRVLDSDRNKVYRIVNSSGEVLEQVDYTVAGPTAYRGSATIDNGEFNFEFITPLDIGYGGQGAKISVYAQFEDVDAAGIIDSIAVSDSVVASTDSAGPVIEVAFVGRQNFASGDYISAEEQMRVVISDNSGVNLTGSLGHGITLEIDRESEKIVNLTPLFEAYQDDYTTGSLTYPLIGLSAGSHHLKVKAWDNANNSSVYEFDVEVLMSEGLAIRELLNYPNPMQASTRFSFYLTQQVEKFSLELFTLSGKKIKSFHRYSLAPGYYDDIEWYGQDNDGSRVATEVYIYKATAYPADGGGKVESFGKLVLIN